MFFFTCRLKHLLRAPLNVSERHGSKIKQLSAAIGMARKQNYYLSLAENSTSYGGL